MDVAQILPRPSERALFLGATGTGKTTLAISLIRLVRFHVPIHILDIKGDEALELPGAVVIERARVYETVDAPVKVYQPEPNELLNAKVLDEWLRRRYDEGGPSLTYIDELLGLGIQQKPLPGLLALLTRGRSRGTALWATTQRPAWVSRYVFSEIQHFYIFSLTDLRDRRRVAEFTYPSVIEPLREKHSFFYYRVGGECPRILKLQKGGRAVV